jgi:cytochrome c oxidase subunit 2
MNLSSIHPTFLLAQGGDASLPKMGPLTDGSTMAGPVDTIFWFVTWVSIFFFVLVVGLMIVFVVKYRRRTHVASTEGPTHNTPLELTWSIIPLLLVIVMFYMGMKAYLQMRVTPQDAYEIYVSGQKWQWTFSYRNGATVTNELIVPVNRPVRLIMESSDVLHALFVPAFRLKRDVVPGRKVEMWFEATKPGEYDMFCAEYCGKGHAEMVGKVTVYASEADFEARMTDEANWIKNVGESEMSLAGAYLYNRCQACHSLDGSRVTGPSWKGLWEKLKNGDEQFEDGTMLRDIMGPGKTFENAEAYIEDSMVNPQSHVVATYPNSMPTFKGSLKQKERDALTEFIKNVDTFTGPDGKLKPLPPRPGKSAPVTAPDSAAPAGSSAAADGQGPKAGS